MAECPSAIQEALTKVEDQLTCPVCLEPFSSPRLLACFHVYCEHCLEQLVASDRQGQVSIIACPKCRRTTTLPSTGVSSLQAAFHVYHLFDIQNTLKKVNEPQKLACEKCSVTTARVATSFCRDCQKFICEFCNTVHQEWEDFKGHSILSMETVKGDLIRFVSPKKTTPRCSKHNKSLKVYCEQCGELICKDCIIHLHRDHDYCLIVDTFESHKKDILDSLKPVEKELKSTTKVLVDLESRYEKIVKQQQSVEAEIRTTFSDIHKKMDTCEAKLVAQLQDHMQEQLKNISAWQKNAENLQTQCSSCLHFVKESIHTGSPGDVMKMKRGVVKQVNDLVDSFSPTTPKACEQDCSTCFVHSTRLTQAIQKFTDLCTTLQVSVLRTKRMLAEKSQKQVIAVVQNLSEGATLGIGARVMSTLTNQVKKCAVTEQPNGTYEISLRPTLSGVHHLYLTVGEEEVRGNPFSVAVKTPSNKIGTLIKCIKGVKCPGGLAVNKSGELLVCEGNSGFVSIFNPKGDRLRKIHLPSTTTGSETNSARAVAVDGEGNVLVIGSSYRLLKFSSDGDLIVAVGGKGNESGQFKEPVGVCGNNANGKVYVVDKSGHCIHIFNSDLTFCRKFGSKGKGASNFDYPDDISCDPSGCLYVADCSNWRVKVFTPDGVFLRQFQNQPGEIWYTPTSICVDSDYLVYVGTMGYRDWDMLVFTSEGQLLKRFPPSPNRSPNSIAVDGNGVVYLSFYDDIIRLF